jgi:uroporphyrinogen decarboxylase
MNGLSRMDATKNALRIINFDRPERVITQWPNHAISFLGADHEGFEDGGHHMPIQVPWTDIWGVTWVRELEGMMGFPQRHPLSNLPASLPSFRWPDPDDARIAGRIYEQARSWNRDETFLTGSHRDTLWEKSYMLAGMENMMVYFRTEPGAVCELLHHIMDFHLGIARHYLQVGVELVTLGDDLGIQDRLLLPPEVIGQFLVPEYRRIFELYRKEGVLISFHSCGHVTPLLDLFMELGVSILSPVQATANDLHAMRRVTQGKMALQGGVSSATIYDGPVEAIRREVARRLWQLGREGGYFCGPDQVLPWPAEHIQAFEGAVEEFGRYPLQEPLDDG